MDQKGKKRITDPKKRTMFDNLFGDMEQKQADLRKKLSEIQVEAEAGDGAVKVVANANRQIVNVQLDKDKIDWEDKEQIEDLVLVAVNKALEEAAEREAVESQKLIQDILPPGMGDMSNLFG